MRRGIKRFFAVLLFFFAQAALATPEIDDSELRRAVEELSASTLIGGEGWQVADRLLHPAYARWAMGEVFERREKFVRSLEAWWNAGMRVAERESERVAVDRVGEIAIIRVKTRETFVGPDGPTVGFVGYVSNTWVRENGQWLLLSADISSVNLQP